MAINYYNESNCTTGSQRDRVPVDDSIDTMLMTLDWTVTNKIWVNLRSTDCLNYCVARVSPVARSPGIEINQSMVSLPISRALYQIQRISSWNFNVIENLSLVDDKPSLKSAPQPEPASKKAGKNLSNFFPGARRKSNEIISALSLKIFHQVNICIFLIPNINYSCKNSWQRLLELFHELNIVAQSFPERESLLGTIQRVTSREGVYLRWFIISSLLGIVCEVALCLLSLSHPL